MPSWFRRRERVPEVPNIIVVPPGGKYVVTLQHGDKTIQLCDECSALMAPLLAQSGGYEIIVSDA